LPEALAAPSISDALTRAAARLAAAGCDTPRLDAELLLASVLGATRSRLVLDAHRALEGEQQDLVERLLARREAREPVAYILGRRDFRQISLAVDPRVLIPRPETELLVEVALELAPATRVVDVGTGSGAVALALKQERPDLAITATDISADALVVARDNAARLGLEVEFRHGDLLAGAYGQAVLANLPYVAEGGPPLPPEVGLYEPASALFAGPDGLEIVRRLIPALGDAELVALEVGFDQAAAVAAMLTQAGWPEVEALPDLAGHERVVLGRR
jgi:release factor glutamine methyltransferase